MDRPEEFSRYAVYWAPEPGSALAEAGAEWLGWDPATGRADPARAADPRVAEPRRYGLHATLKPPFALREGATAAELDAAVAELAAEFAPVDAPALAIDRDLGFFALRPSGPCPALDRLAGETVMRLDAFRAPMTDAERAKRRALGLSSEQSALLDLWGYPYVLEEFRFHATLTGRIADDATARETAAELEPRFGPCLGDAFRLDAIALFGDPGGGEGFRLLRHHALTG